VKYWALATAARRGSKEEGNANLGGDRAPEVEAETALKREVQLPAPLDGRQATHLSTQTGASIQSKIVLHSLPYGLIYETLQ
jgi:hypothetical protein